MKLTNLLFITLLGITIPTQLPAMAATRSALPVSAQETVYLFDYHDVMAKQNNSIAFRYVRNNIHPLYFLRLVGSLSLFGVNKIAKLSKPMLNIEYATLNNVTCAAYQNYVLNIINPFTIDPGMLEYVRDIKARGSMAFLFSNVGQKSFDFMDGARHIDPLFDGKYICDASNNFINKKSPEAFKALLHKQIIPHYQAQHGINTLPKRIVMIDDDSKKLAIAEQSLKTEQALHPELAGIQFVSIVFQNVEQAKATIFSLIQAA